MPDDAMNPPVFRKDMVVCTPFGEYTNGDQEGVMSRARLRKIADNYKRYRRQVPIYALGDHVEDLDSRVPDGWVEDLSINQRGELVASVKLHGTAAAAVIQDLIRGASIGTVQGKNPDGSAQGEVLQHLLLTNNPFDKSLNIAAARKAGEPVACFFTAIRGDRPMADEKPKPETPETPAADPEESTAQLKAKDDEIVRLKAENLELKEKLENATVDEEKHELALRVAKLERKTLAQDVREVVLRMLKEGTIKPAKVDGYAKGGDDGTLSWFKASIFRGDMALLKFAAENNPPLFKVGQSFRSGAPTDNGEKTLTNEDRELIRKLGMSPEAVQAGMKAANFTEYKELQPKGKE